MNPITYEEACERIHAAILTTRIRPRESVPIHAAAGRALAAPIYASSDYPNFDNSAVDGYAIGTQSDAAQGARIRVIGEAAAGTGIPADISPRTALRIFTGAPVPANCFAVLMQEDAEREGDEITLQVSLDEGKNIRRAGADFKKGDQLLSPGATIGAGHIGLLASQGNSDVRVFSKVSCGILTTGDELVGLDEEPHPGLIYDSNTPMLTQLALSAGCGEIHEVRSDDNREGIKASLARLCAMSEIVLVSGGASVGDHDHIASVVAELGQIIFHGARIRPGKPILFGKIGDSYVFGLPGNPASAFVCFEIFVRDAIRRLGGHARSALNWVSAGYLDEHSAMDRDDFVRGVVSFEDGRLVARRVREQGSFGLMSIAEANALVRIPAETSGSTQCSTLLLLQLRGN